MDYRRVAQTEQHNDPYWSEKFRTVLDDVTYKDNYILTLGKDGPDGRWYFQVGSQRPDAYTGDNLPGKGGRAYLAPGMTEGQLVRVVFGLFKAYEEHECREFFKWRGGSIYGPHISTDALLTVADRLDLGIPL